MANKNKRKKERKLERRKERQQQKKLNKKQHKTKGNGNMTDFNNTKVQGDDELDKLIAEHDKGGAFKSQIAAAQACWDAGIEIKKGCAHMPIPKYHVYFEPLAHQKIKKLQAYYPSLEWLAYLEGEINHEEKTVTVKDLVIPTSQQVTSVTVYNVEYGWNEGRSIIGVIHSHHGMGAFFSGTDDSYINQNHDVSIVVSTSQRSPIKGQVRVKTPCDSYVLAENENVTFSVKYPQVLDEAEFEAEFTSKINKYTAPVITYIGGMGNGYGVGYGGYGSGYGYGGGYYSGQGSNLYGRGSANPPRNLPANLPVDDDDPYELEDADVRLELARYYSQEEIDEFMEDESAREELLIIRQLEANGLVLATGDDDSGVWLSEDAEEQDGDAQIEYGIPLKDQTEDGEEADGWNTDETSVKEVVAADEEQTELAKTAGGNTVH